MQFLFTPAMTDAEGEKEEAIIDIPFDQLLDWLRARHLLHSSYPAHLKAISSITTTALTTLPPSLTSHLPPPSSFSYLTALNLRSLLLTSSPTPPPTTWLGHYADPTLHTWDSICRQYEKSNVFLAELSRLLFSHTQHHIPTSQRDITRATTALTDLSRRILDARKTLKTLTDRYHTHCHTLGILIGERNEAAMQGQIMIGISDVHPLLAEVVGRAQEEAVGEAIDYYDGWVRWTGDVKVPPQLVTLRKIRDLQRDRLIPEGEKENTRGGAVQGVEGEGEWEIQMEGAGESGETDEAPQGDTTQSSAIRWDDGPATDAVPPTSTSFLPPSVSSSVGVLPSSSLPDPTGLLSPVLRSAFLSDVSELTAFLSQRLSDLTQSQSLHSPLLSYLHSSLPPALHLPSTSPSTLTRLLSALHSLTSSLQHRRLTQTLLIASSPSYVLSLTRTTLAMRRGIERTEREVRELEGRWRETRDRGQRERERVDRLQGEVTQWKELVESTITRLCHHRVQLTG